MTSHGISIGRSTPKKINEDIQAVDELPPEEENRFLWQLITECAQAAQTKGYSGSTVRRRPPTPWWDDECNAANKEKSKAFIEFRKSGIVDRYKIY